jgi:hypothetical protein
MTYSFSLIIIRAVRLGHEWISNSKQCGCCCCCCCCCCGLQWLGAGGLLAFARPSTPDIYMFDLTNPAQPQYKHGYTSKTGSCMDEFVAHKSGGFIVSSMCGRDGECVLPPRGGGGRGGCKIAGEAGAGSASTALVQADTS